MLPAKTPRHKTHSYFDYSSAEAFAVNARIFSAEAIHPIGWRGSLLHSSSFRRYGWGRNRTADTRIFSPLLCQLSYPAVTDADLATCLGVPTMQQSNCRASDPLAIGPVGDAPPRGFGVQARLPYKNSANSH